MMKKKSKNYTFSYTPVVVAAFRLIVYPLQKQRQQESLILLALRAMLKDA
ncbi:hypothetical protein ACFS7Z_17365 [Pontibacter toksunensis]|uniref:Transposase n=1 Tax=Pontibacter toksunensis TaxID=1332631 RepID=A0ABW6BYJ4_9BACT